MKRARIGDWITFGSGVLVIGAVVAFVIWQWPSIVHIFSNPDDLREYVKSFGFWAPFAFVALYVLQIVVAPIPGSIMNFAGGLLFGWTGGVLLSWIACIVGASVSIGIMRVFGRSLMRIFLSDEKIDKFDSYVRTRGWVYLFLIYLIPNPIGDSVNYMAALSGIRFWKLLVMVAIGRLPSLMIGSLIGTQSIRFQTIHWIILGVAFVVLLVGVYLVHKPLEALAIKLSAKLFPPRSPEINSSQIKEEDK